MQPTRTRRTLYRALDLLINALTALLSPAVYLIRALDWLDAQTQRHVLRRDVDIPKLRDGIRLPAVEW